MTRAAFVVPGDLSLPTGGYAYDRRVLGLLPGLGIEARHVALPGTYPTPTKPDLDKLERAIGDALTGIVFRDDSQIAWWSVWKVYGEPARAHIEIATL